MHPYVTAKTIAELIALAKSESGRLSYASQFGSNGRLNCEMIKMRADINLLRAPYKGV